MLPGSARLEGALFDQAQLGGASFNGARLYGASLQFAHIMGASFNDSELLGANLENSNLNGALFEKIFAWRARVRGEGARVIAPVIGPIHNCGGPCDWKDDSFAELKRLITEQVPEGERREAALGRIAILDPERHEDREQAMANVWLDLAKSPPAPDIHEKSLAEWLGQAGCSTDAPYAIRGLLGSLGGRFGPKSSQPALLATQFLDEEHCPGARGLSEEDKAKLREIRDPH